MPAEVIERRNLEILEARGWALQAVLGDTPEGSWIYTVGLGSALGTPELLLAGVPLDAAGWFLDELVHHVAAAGMFPTGRDCRHAVEVEDFHTRFACLGVDQDLAHRSSLVAVAHSLAPVVGPVLGVVQVVTCDARGRMPWEEGSQDADAMLLDHPLESVRRLFS